MAYGDPEIKLLGVSPHLGFTPEVYYSLRRLFSKSTNERMAYLHGNVDNETFTGLVTDISIPPQWSGPGTCEPNHTHERFMDFNDEMFERGKKAPIIGMVHSFSGGGHHSDRDHNTDSLEAERAFDRGDKIHFSVTMSSGSKANPETQVEAIITLGGNVQMTMTKCAFGMEVPEYSMFERVDTAEDLIAPKPVKATSTKGSDKGKGGLQLMLSGTPSSSSSDRGRVITISADDNEVDEFFDGEYYNSDHIYNPQKKLKDEAQPKKPTTSSKPSTTGKKGKASSSKTKAKKKKRGSDS